MTTRNDFYGFRLLIQELEQKSAQYEEIQKKIGTPASARISDIPKNCLYPNFRIEYMLNKRMELSDKINTLKLRISIEKAILDRAMECLNISERTVLESRYFLLYSWEEIAGIIFAAYPDFKKRKDEYVQKTRIIQSSAFKKIERQKNV